MPGLETEIVMHHQAHAGLCRDLHDGSRFLHRRRQRLLAEDMHPALRRQSGQRQMGLGRRDDIHEVGLLAVEHGGDIGIGAGNAEFARGLARLRGVQTAQGGDLCLSDPLPGIEMVLAEIAGADSHAAKLFPVHARPCFHKQKSYENCCTRQGCVIDVNCRHPGECDRPFRPGPSSSRMRAADGVRRRLCAGLARRRRRCQGGRLHAILAGAGSRL